ncbi:MAG: transposase [Terriglobia bacterium]
MIRERREEQGFLLCAWVFLADHWHALFYPAHPLTIGRVVESIKDAATKRINSSRREVGRLLQPRFFDRAWQRQWLGGEVRRNTSQAHRSGRLELGASTSILAR